MDTQHQPEPEDGIVDYHQQADSAEACESPDIGSLQQPPQQGEIATLGQQQLHKTELAQQNAAQVAGPVMQQTPPAAPEVLACAGMIIRKRGTLAAAAGKRQQQLTKQQQLVQEWQGFAARQARRYVPAPPNPSRRKRLLQDSACYRLRVLHVCNLPASQQSSGVKYGLQLGVTLFDEAVGQHYGSTCYSLVEPLQGPKEQQAVDANAGGDSSGPSVDFSFDVFFHTVISDAHCMGVVELILVELEDDNSYKTKFSAGWAQVPLFARTPKVGALLHKPLAGGQTPASAPVMGGTPRYLQLRAVCGDQLPPPAVLGSCMVSYQVEAYPAMNPARPLLPQDFLVSYTDVIPGLRRFDLAGHPSTALHSSLNTLASPLLDMCVVSFQGVQLVVPQLLHNLLSVLPELLGALPPSELASMLAVPCQPEAVAYSMRLRVHNGRAFVGPWVTVQLQVQPHLGSILLSPAPGQQLAIDWLLQDRLVVLVLELLAGPPTAAGAANAAHAEEEEAGMGAVLVGRSVLAPFDEVMSGSAAVLAAGKHKLAFDSTSSMGSMCSSSCWAPKGCSTGMLAGSTTEPGDLLLPLNWRAMLGDTAIRAVPDPTIQLELQRGFGRPRLPEAAAALAGNSSSTTTPACAGPLQATCMCVSTVAPGAVPVNNTLHISPAAAPPVVVPPLTHSPGSPEPTWQPPLAKSSSHESPAARSLKLAAQHLQEAANIPVQTPSTTTCGGRHSDGAADSQVDAASRQQLQQLAQAMQQQLDLLAHAVAELRQERQTLRSSLTVLEFSQQRAEAAAHAAMHDQRQQELQQPASKGATAAAADLGWLSSVPETAQGDLAGFSGQVLHEPYRRLTPSRAVLQQLHEAGMTHTLPADVQARLQAQAALGSLSLQQHLQPQLHAGHSSRMATLLLDVEARDPRTASDTVLQLLALRPAAAPGAALQLPSSLSSVYFTLQFYKSGPIVTDTCLLAASSYGQHTQGVGADGSAGVQGPSTFMLLPQHQACGSSPAGAGVVLKFSVDGSRASELRTGQDPVQAAAAAHMAFCKYLVSHKLAVDVWDGESLLQLGSCTADLVGLLRQGRDLSDLLLELPLLKDCTHGRSGPAASGTVAGQHVGKQQRPVQLGTLVLRLINIGREPRNVAGAVAADAALAMPVTPGKKVCVRAAPLQPGSPVAKELRGGGSPFAVDWHHSDGRMATSESSQAPDVSASTDAALAAADIIGLEQRKIVREQKLKELLHSPSSSPTHSAPGALHWPLSRGQGSPAGKLASTWTHASPTKGQKQQQQQQQQQWRPGSPLSTMAAGEGGEGDGVEPYKALQRQLLSDVDAVRKRQKPGFIRSQLRKSLVTQCSIQPSPGQAMLLEHTLTNSIGRDAVFELRVSHPQELTAVESLQGLRDLQQSVGTVVNTAAAAAAGMSAGSVSPGKGTAAVGGTAPPLKLRQLAQQAAAAGGAAQAVAEQQIVSRGRVFLAAHESVSIPLRFLLPCEQPAGAGTTQQQTQQQQQQQHTVTVQFVPLGLDWPVSILELAVLPEPAVVSRTLRYYCPERELLHLELPLAELPWISGPVLAAAAVGKLTAAASRSDVSVLVRELQQTAADAEPQQQQQYVCLRYRCGAAQEAVQFYVWLYGDAAMAQPLEAWQVFVHPLQHVDMRATVGQQSSTTLAVAGGSADRLVAAYSSQPGELQAAPAMLSLPAGGISALGLVFKPRSPGQQRVRIHLVDVNTRQLVHALVVCTDAHLPPLHRQMEVTVQAGAVAQHQFEVANTTNRPASYSITTNTPWLLAVATAGTVQIPAGSSRVISLACDARRLSPGSSESGLVFVNDAHNRLQHEECVVVTVEVV